MTDTDDDTRKKDRLIRKLQLANELLTLNLQDMEEELKEMRSELIKAEAEKAKKKAPTS